MGITVGYVYTVMEMTPGDKAVFMKATSHTSDTSTNDLKSQSAWSCSVCHSGDTDTYTVQRVSYAAAANSVLEHTGIVELVRHESAWVQYESCFPSSAVCLL